MSDNYLADDDYSAYHNDSIVLEEKYQHLMDWSIWLEEYYLRAETDIDEDKKTFFFGSPYHLGPLHNAESILDVLSKGKKLCSIKLLSQKGVGEYFFKNFPRIPIYGNAHHVMPDRHAYDVNNMLTTAESDIKKLLSIQLQGQHIAPKIAVFDKDVPIKDFLAQAEEVWLRWQGRELEAQLIRLTRIFPKKGTPVRGKGNMPRAIGLWLWDYMEMKRKQGEAISITTAVDAFSDKYPLQDLLPDKNPPPNYLIFLYSRTDKCIGAKKVLPFRWQKGMAVN